MFKIRPEHIRTFQPTAEAAFARQTMDYIRTAHGDAILKLATGQTTVGDLNANVLRKMVEGGIAQAREHGINLKSEMISFVTTQFLTAPNFDEHPVAKQVLSEVARLAEQNFERVLDAMTDEYWAEVEKYQNPKCWNVPLEDLKPAKKEAAKSIEPPKPAEENKTAETPKPSNEAKPKKTVKKPAKQAELKKQVKAAHRTQHHAPVAPKQACPNKNWVELNYKYVSHRPVKHALYEVSTKDGQLLASGALDAKGFARVEGLPDGITDINFKYTSDPQPFKIFGKHTPVKNPLQKNLVHPSQRPRTAKAFKKTAPPPAPAPAQAAKVEPIDESLIAPLVAPSAAAPVQKNFAGEINASPAPTAPPPEKSYAERISDGFNHSVDAVGDAYDKGLAAVKEKHKQYSGEISDGVARMVNEYTIPISDVANAIENGNYRGAMNLATEPAGKLVHAYVELNVAVGKWTWGAIQGDWNDDQTFGQILLDTVISMIPVVDQAADVRDLSSTLKKMIWDKKYDEFGNWFSLVTTGIGCIPTVGSVVKGIVKSIAKVLGGIGGKIVKNFDKAEELIRLLNHFGEGNAVRWIREQIDNWGKHTAFVKGKIIGILESLQAKCLAMRERVIAKGKEIIDRVLAGIKEVLSRAGEIIVEMMNRFLEFMKDLAQKIKDFFLGGKTQKLNGAKQLESPPVPAKAAKKVRSLAETAAEAGMEVGELEGFIKHCKANDRRVVVRFTNAKALQWHRVDGYVPKSVYVKLKTAKSGPHAGLVVRPKGAPETWEKFERDNMRWLLDHKYTFDKNDVLVSPDGKRFYGDYDLQSVHRQFDDPETGKKIYMSELTDAPDPNFMGPHQPSVMDEINHDVGRQSRPIGQSEPVAHGAEENFWVLKDEKGKPIEEGIYGKNKIATEEDIREGRAVLGRQYGSDEKYLVIHPDGRTEVMENPRELYEKVYRVKGDRMVWNYNAPPPSHETQAIIDAEWKAEKAAKEQAEAARAAAIEAERTTRGSVVAVGQR